MTLEPLPKDQSHLLPEESVLDLSLPRKRVLSYGPSTPSGSVSESLSTELQVHRLRELCDLHENAPAEMAVDIVSRGMSRRDVYRDWIRPGSKSYDNLAKYFQVEKVAGRESSVPEGISLETLRLIEALPFCNELQKSCGLAGRAAIASSVLHPSRSEELIKAKQEAYRELASDPELRAGLSQLNRAYVQSWETRFLKFLSEGLHFTQGYGDYSKLQSAHRRLSKATETLPEPKSPYLKMLLDEIRSIQGSELTALLKHGMNRTEEGLRPKRECKDVERKKIFTPWQLDREIVYRSLPLVTGTVVSGAAALAGMLTPPFGHSYIIPGVLAIGLGVSSSFLMSKLTNQKVEDDQLTVADILTEVAEDEGTLKRVISAFGRLGELLGGDRHISRTRAPLVFPEVKDASHHYFRAKDMSSPLFLDDPSYVASDVRIDEQSLTFLTGPNSGGKTTTARALLLNQLRAQMALPIPCSSAEIGIANYIAYQAPQFNEQGDTEGRFGTELAKTREIVFRSDPKSFTILDELAEGTTNQEKNLFSRAILEALAIKQSSTVLITHDLELTRLYEKLGVGDFSQVEFKDGQPTFRIIPGISSSSHAARIATRIGFSLDDIRSHLQGSDPKQLYESGDQVPPSAL